MKTNDGMNTSTLENQPRTPEPMAVGVPPLATGWALLVPTISDPADNAVALAAILEWPNGVKIQEQRNRWCSSYLVMRCPDCGEIDEPLCTDGDAYQCRCCAAVHDFPPNVEISHGGTHSNKTIL